MAFQSLEHMVLAAAEAVRPPERIDVPTAAERYHIVKTAGQHAGPFSLAKTPYLREPMEVLTSLDYTGMIFAGPARTGKSAMFINWLCHTAITDPSDMMIVHMSRDNAREWSNGDLARAIRNSPELAARIRPGRNNDNTFDKTFLSGMRLSVTWPTIKNLSGKTIRYTWIMDSDRIKPQLIDNEAHVYDATKKRTGTFKRYGMTVAEASPGFPVKDAKWKPSASEPHEAPPCEGILSLYNRGDRRRFFWECLFCADWFEPRFNLLRWPDSADVMEAAEQAHMACPHCFDYNKNALTFDMLPELNGGGRWIKEGQRMVSGELVGTPRRSDIASFWMFGPAAGLASDWKTLVLNYLRAVADFEKTGNDANLMTTVTVDQGEAYVPPSLQSGLLPDTLKNRAEDWGGHDAEGVPYLPAAMNEGGFLVSAIDVQGGGRPSFVVHTFAVTKGFDIWHVDMRKITHSERRDPATNERYLLDPAAHPEDWDLLVSQVIEYTYPLPDGSGRRMAVKMTVCDSGGKAGVTRNAYEFYHRLRERGEEKRFHLLAGRPSRNDTATIRMSLQENWSDIKRFAIPLGAIPLWLVNSNIVKDAADAKLRRAETGGMVHFPHWAQDWLYAQLTTEVRDPDKGWQNPNDKRNEAWDLLCYCIAFCDHPDIRIRYLDWENPPTWAAGWDRNDYVVEGGAKPFQVEFETKPRRSLADLARDLA